MKIKKILLILLCVPLIGLGQDLGDYFISEGHNKSKGLNFKIKTPIGFEQMEGSRPNIIQKWVKNKTDNKKMETFLILIKDLPDGMDMSQEDWRSYFLYEGGIDDMIESIRETVEHANASNEKHIRIDQYSGCYFESDYTIDMSERLPLDIPEEYKIITMYSLNAWIFVEEHICTFSMSTTNKLFLDKKLFLNLIYSTVFLDQYK